MRQDSSVNEVDDYGLDNRGSILGRKWFFSRHCVQTGSGTSLLSNGYWGFFHRV